MPATTGGLLVGDAFALLNAFLPGESIPPNDGEFARRFLNDLLSEWSQRERTIAFVSRNAFPLVGGKGGPNNPYTIGVGGDFDVDKPSNQDSIKSANLILTPTAPNVATVRVPLGIFTTDAYDANQIPDLANTQPTGLFYNPTFANDLGQISLWPVPTSDLNQLELFLLEAIPQFANLTTTYYVPDGVPGALKYGLAYRLQVPYHRQLSPDAKEIAVSTLATYTRANTNIADLANDATFTQNRRTLFNIQTGSGG